MPTFMAFKTILKQNSNIPAGLLIGLFLALIMAGACRKRLPETEANIVVDKIAVNFGNDRVFSGFTIKNTGEKLVGYHVDEQIDWLEINNSSGELPGTSEIEIIGKVTRTGLPQNNYSGQLYLYTGSGDYTLDVFMTVDMFLVTFINPVFSTIVLEIDTLQAFADTSLYKRLIGKNDSVQFGFFSAPSRITYFAQTSGRYSDSTQLGLPMKWEGQQLLNGEEMPRLFLDVSKAYFHLSIINNNQVLNPLYVNAGTQFEIIENIFIFQSSDPLPVGYYHAFQNTLIRAYEAGSSNTITWSNGGQFVLPFSINQSVVIDTYSNDTLKKKSILHPDFNSNPQISRVYGNVIELLNN
jgi:hypothetical protein